MNRIGAITQKPFSGGLGRKSGTAGRMFNVGGSDVAAPEASHAAREMNALSGILALQEYGAEENQNKKACRYGYAMLEMLGELQSMMLEKSDALAKGGAGLAQMFAQQPKTVDPILTEILGAISLRVKIELLHLGVEVD